VTHPHAPPEPSPEDGGFLRTFLATLAGLLLLIAGLSWVVDPLGAFGTGLIPPAVTADRDQKAALYRERSPAPAIVILGSSRSKTVAPACLERLTGQPGFNFAVNGAGTEDFLAILRYLQSQHPGAIRTIYVGLDPETMQGTGGIHRALESSRALAPFVGQGGLRARIATFGSDLFGWQAVHAAVASLRLLRAPAVAPPVVLDPDGVQVYRRVEERLAAGGSLAEEVAASVPNILSRYEAFPGLDSGRVATFRGFLTEAHAAGVEVIAFIPPVHPALARAASATAWQARTEETVQLVKALELRGLLRYVETRDLAALRADSTRFLDGVHFLAPVAARVAEALAGHPDGCALQ
jgi:hypothetical protein